MNKWILVLLLSPLMPVLAAEEEINTQNQKAMRAPVDERIGAQLESLDLDYEVDEDNDFKVLFNFDDNRSQLVFIRSKVYDSNGVGMRDVWSYAFPHPTRQLPLHLERRLLQESYSTTMGAWARDGNAVVYIIRVPENAPDPLLRAALYEAAELADELEKELLGTDEL